MNIPVTELHNDDATWNQSDFKRCPYCDNDLDIDHNDYCDDTCEENHISDMHNELTGFVDNIEWRMESVLQLSTVIYKRAYDLGLIKTCEEIIEIARENGFYIKEIK